MASVASKEGDDETRTITDQLGGLDLNSGRNQFITKGSNWRARHVLMKWFGSMQFECTTSQGPWVDGNTLYEMYVHYVAREFNTKNEDGSEKAPEVGISDLDRFRSDLWCFLNTLRGWKQKVDYWKVRNFYSIKSPYVPQVTDNSVVMAQRGKQRWTVAEAAAQNSGLKQTKKQWKYEKREEHAKLKEKRGAARGINPLSGRDAGRKGSLTTLRYFNEFLRLKCAADLIDFRLFPDAGEITETMAVMEAARRHLQPDFSIKDDSVTFVSVADGSTPRTAATLAYLTRWQCHSVDPQLKPETCEKFKNVARLHSHGTFIEQFSLPGLDKAVVALVHAHVDLVDVLRSIPAQALGIIAIPCCDYYPRLTLPGMPPDLEYQDEAIYSPNRTIRIWKNVNARAYIKVYDTSIATGVTSNVQAL